MSRSIGNLNVAKLFSPMLIVAKLVFSQRTVMPISDSLSHTQGCNRRVDVGHLYLGPGGIYSPFIVVEMTRIAIEIRRCFDILCACFVARGTLVFYLP